VPPATREFRGLGVECTDGELDTMPVVERRLADHLGIRFLAHAPSEMWRPLYRESPVMSAVGEVEREDSSSDWHRESFPDIPIIATIPARLL
jgi:hypothetical protein